ncbi:uncharacterized protein [Solanum tuberosum]|uniref:Uncharacterized protein n=1 Tax=Solanum tuberosum TaxID=4113 RepID=M1BWT9_SOLTU|nr:PREDICTED: uncharacterized protein LOC102592849 [Solanum tuberosum]
MESILWNLEDKWKLSTQESIAFFICTCSLIIVICLVTAFFKRRAATRRKGLVGQDPCSADIDVEWSEPKLLSSNTSVKKVLTSTVRWSGPSKWEENRSTERVSPLLEGESGQWHSHNSDSPVWQRPILMGEKCELPRFSGLILYDERGRPVHHVDNDQFNVNQENVDVVGRTTLKDLLL